MHPSWFPSASHTLALPVSPLDCPFRRFRCSPHQSPLMCAACILQMKTAQSAKAHVSFCHALLLIDPRLWTLLEATTSQHMAAFVNPLFAIFVCLSEILGARRRPLGALRARWCKSGASIAQVFRKFARRHGTTDLHGFGKHGARRVRASLAQVLVQVPNFGKTRAQEFTNTATCSGSRCGWQQFSSGPSAALRWFCE
jgi:hypothetical protein